MILKERTKYIATAVVIVLLLIVLEVIFIGTLLAPSAALAPFITPEQPLYILLILLLLFGIIVAIAWIWYALTHTPQPGTYGSAHFASRKELRQIIKQPAPQQNHYQPQTRSTYESTRFALPQAKESITTSSYVKESLFFLGTAHNTGIFLSEEQQEGHVLVIAPTRRGKTAGIIIPNLLAERGSRSLLINDVKHELIDRCIGAVAHYHGCYIFAPTQPDESNRYNPLAHVKAESLSDARNVAECIVRNTGSSKEPFWDNSARLLLTAVILHLRTAEPEAAFSRLADICTLSLSEVSDLIDHSQSPLARRVASSFVKNIAAEPRLQSNIMTDVSTRLFDVMDPQIETVTAYDELDFQLLGEKPSALFLHIPPHESARLRWLSSCLIMQLINYLFEHPHKQRFAFYLDELANAGYIPNYLEYISYIGGAGIAFLQVIQDLGQLIRVYEEHGKDTILANSGTKVFLSGVGQVEAEYASRVMGDTTLLARSDNQEGKITYSETARKLMNPDEIRSLSMWSLLVFIGNMPPIIAHQTPYFHIPEALALINLPYTSPVRVHPLPSVPSSATIQTSPLQSPEQKQTPIVRDDDEYFMEGNEDM